jgi:ABC-type phosphate transport system auxiliary subunit
VKQKATAYRLLNRRLKSALQQVDKARADQPDFQLKLQQAMKALNEIADITFGDVRGIESRMDALRVDLLVEKYRQSKLEAPTHPHPNIVSGGGLLERVAESVNKPLDILKDKSRMFPTEKELCALFEEEL